MEVDPDGADGMHRLVTSIVSPRPIGWISTTSDDGGDNLAPFSYFNAVSTSPPAVMFSATTPEGEGLKDTPRNVLSGGEFVVNLVTEEFATAMYRTSERLEFGESEFDHAELERAPSRTVSPPRVAGAMACLECTLYHLLTVYEHTVVIGSVEWIHVDDSITTDGKIDMRKMDVVGRLGGPFYTDVSPRSIEAWEGDASTGTREG